MFGVAVIVKFYLTLLSANINTWIDEMPSGKGIFYESLSFRVTN